MILFILSFNQTLQQFGIYLSDYQIKFCNIYMCQKYSKKDIQMKGSVCMRMKFKKVKEVILYDDPLRCIWC